jgi:hypothetical protein
VNNAGRAPDALDCADVTQASRAKI